MFDRIMFNIENREIPNEYRCIYILLRLISNRISEVLAMQTECISYPDINIFTVTIPTSKETPYHTPAYKKYHRFLNVWCEGLLFETIARQQQNSKNRENEASYENKDYLFISSKRVDSLVSENEFNVFLTEICENIHILNTDGRQAHITSHDFRHIAIVERLQGPFISPHMTMVESNHTNLEQVLEYGYPSLHDEATYLDDIVKGAFTNSAIGSYDEERSHNTNEQIYMSRKKYEALQNQPYTRIIPGHLLCLEKSCVPRYESCFECRFFSPSELYKDYVIECIDIYQDRLVKIHANHGDPEAIEFNEKQLSSLCLFLSRLEEKEVASNG